MLGVLRLADTRAGPSGAGTGLASGDGRAGGYSVVVRVPSQRSGMLGGEARNIASVRAIFLGSHPEWSPPRIT
jgi:hypothetical protein